HRPGALPMTFKACIMHSFDLAMSTETFRHSQRVFILPLDAHRHRLNSAQQQKRGVRIHAASQHGPAFVNVLNHVTPSRNDAADYIRVSTELLRPRMHYQVDANFRGTLVDLWGQTNVNHGD